MDPPVSVPTDATHRPAAIATDHNSTTVFPVPLDLFEPFLQIRRTLAAQTAADLNPAKPEEK